MKKLIIAGLLVIAGLFTPAFTLSWSGLIDNNTKLSANNDFSVLKLNQSNGIYLSLSVPINDNLDFAGEILGKFVLDQNFKTNANSIKFIADSDLLRLQGQWELGNGILSLKAGRFYVSDFTGAAFAQTSDGLSLDYNMSNMSFSVYGGYTGLLNRLNVSMVDNNIAATSDSRPAKDVNFYALCPQYVPVIADFTYKTLFKKHTLGIQAEMFIPVSDKLANKAYGTVTLKGPVTEVITYEAAFTGGLIKFQNFMFDSYANVNLFLIQNTMITAGCEVLSWANAAMIAYVPVTSRTITADSSFAGGILPKASVMYAKDRLYGLATVKGVLAMAGSEAKFHGIDISGSVVYNLFSDLQIGCDLAAFLGLDTFSQTSNYSATIKASLAF